MNITFIQTGGTIDKDYPHSSNGWAFEIHEPALERVLEKLNPSFEYNVISAFKKDSLEITEADLQHLKKMIEKTNSEKLIITHGTDTLSNTAHYLANHNLGKTIVLTGAMRPQKFVDTDADVNLGLAIQQFKRCQMVFLSVCMGWCCLMIKSIETRKQESTLRKQTNEHKKQANRSCKNESAHYS